MKLADDLFDFYKNHLTGDEEDAFVIIEGVLQDFTNEDIEKLFGDLSERERFDMLGLYLYEQFRQKAAEEGVGKTKNRDDQDMKYYH